ncbi:sensor histidine kinase response regulator (hsp90-like protein) [Stagonosporopsis vannaccii]|nr:sensor histidine kinase response regulator (hsp90-like protein) [Stagonosporopsis vannaccii]
MSHAPLTPHIRPVSEKKREREVLQYVAAYRDLPRLELASGSAPSLPADFHARLSTDSTLNALCQLAALRMNAQRALVSLIDDKCQHVLAEATPRTSLHGGDPPGGSNLLWLGSVSIPRSFGVCEEVLSSNAAKATTNGRTSVVVHKDLRDSSQHAQRTYVQSGPRMRFYAGVPLVAPHGAIVGALCVFDDEPRQNVSVDEEIFISDLSATVIDYLGNYTVKDRFKRGEKLTRGLISFAEGASALLPLDKDDQVEPEQPSSTATSSTLGSEPGSAALRDGLSGNHTSDVAETGDAVSQTSQTGSQGLEQKLSGHKEQQFSAGSATVRAGSTRVTSLRALQDTILPMNSRAMFARAANLMLASSDLDGVLILDASVAATGHRQHPAAPERERFSEGLSDSPGPNSKSESSDDSSSQSSNANQGPNTSLLKTCQILGAAPPRPSVNTDGTPGIESLVETNLARLLREHPHGKVFNFTADGVSMSSTDDSSSNNNSHEEALGHDDPRRTAHRKRGPASRSSKAISVLLPNARSVAFVPFWDYERSRWFAGCLCWTNNPDRLLSVSVDLAYFNIFSHSIMRELSRLDAIALNQQKTTFVASISHELRSPLHGILGTLEFIKDTPLDTFQTSMLNSLNSCGQTLLDTINHVMDHSKMSETSKNVSSRRLKNTKTVRLSSKPIKTKRSLRDPSFDLSIATEEVVEAVFAGSSFLPIMSSKNAPMSPTESTTTTSTDTDTPDITTKRKMCYIILDMAHEQDWTYCFPIGPWKRTVMNLFGNAIKYTQSGHIIISLNATDVTRSTGMTTTVTLTINDTGTGMSPEFLANKAFQPFSQENPHSSGVGLGLSIVRQIIETNGGKIQISSDHSTGTKITVKLSLSRPQTAQVVSPRKEEFLSWLPRLKGRRICILHRVENDQDLLDEPQNAEGLRKFTSALTTTLTNHLRMDVVQTTTWEGNDADLVICPEPSFAYLASIRTKRIDTNAAKAAVTIFVALDALEAATLRSDVRVQDKESVVEIMTQPLGPYKLAYVLNRCLDRFESSNENAQRSASPIDSRWPSNKGVTRTPPPLFLSPALDERPPLLDQPYWNESDMRDTPVPTLQGPENPKPGPGTTAVTEHELPIRPKLSTPTRSVDASSNVLITDDNTINRRLLVAFMKKYNLQYTEAENGLEALRAYQSAPSQFDVILMDMSMPVMDGVSATRAIRQYEQEYNISRCYIIAVTGLASASAKLEAWNSGIDHFMTKPINFKQLEKFLKKLETRRGEATGVGGLSSSSSASSGS